MTMMYNTQNYWLFGLYLLYVQLLGLALSEGPNRVGVFPPPHHLRTERD
jgi:hypothetical protein